MVEWFVFITRLTGLNFSASEVERAVVVSAEGFAGSGSFAGGGGGRDGEGVTEGDTG